MSTQEYQDSTIEDVPVDISYEEYHNQISLIQELLTELILGHNRWGQSVESDCKVWSKSRLLCQLLDGLINPGIALVVVCPRSFTLLHVEGQLTSIEQIIRFPDNDEITELESNVTQTTVFVPFSVIFCLLREFPNAVMYTNTYTNTYATERFSYVGEASRQTALHNVVNSLSSDNNNNDVGGSNWKIGSDSYASVLMVFGAILEVCPKAVNIRDDFGDLPIDVLARIILMKEESFKYASSGRIVFNDDERLSRYNTYIEVEKELLESWELAKFLVMAHCRLCDNNYGNEISWIYQDQIHSWKELEKSISNETALSKQFIHGCLIAPDIPLSLVEHALRRFGNEQLTVPDSNGNLPLHLVSAKTIGVRDSDLDGVATDPDDEEDEVDTSYNYLLNVFIQRYPDAASVSNNDGCIPLDLAIRAGRKWETGIRSLLHVNPLGLTHNLTKTKLPFNRFPMIMASLSNSDRSESSWISYVIFSILMSNPDLTKRNRLD